MKIQQFQGGKASRLAPHFLQLNQGVVYENIDNSVGTLTPVKKSLPSGILLDKFQHFYDAQQKWVSSAVRRDYVEYSGDLYWTDRSTQPQKYNGTTQTNLGIAVPSKLTSFTISLAVTPVAEITAKPVLGSGLPKEDMRYIAVNVGSSKVSDPLSFIVRESGKIDTGSVAGGGAIASLVAQMYQAKAEAATTRDIVIKNPVGFTIASGGVDIYRQYQGQYRLVGNLATSSSSLTDNVEDISGNAAFDLANTLPLNGVYQYVLTFVNSVDGTESGPSSLSAELDLSNGGGITINSIPVSADPQVDKKRLYRIGGDLTSLTLVVELTNATTSYVDELADVDLLGTILSTSIALPAPSDLAFLTEAYAMLFAAQGSKLRFTPIGKPDQWPELYFLQFDADITGIAAVTNGILVFTEFKTFIVTGTGPTSLSQQPLTTNQGCLAFESVQVLSGAALWVSSDGICLSNGGEPIVISKDQLGKQTLDVKDSAIHDEVYYALLVDNTMLAYDFAYSKIFKTFSLGNESIVVGNDVLYGWSDGELQTLFASTEYETLKYVSPRFIEGSATEQKTYKNVHVYHKGDIIFKVLIDDVLVATAVLSGEDTTWVKVPQSLQRGNFIQFEIEGAGEVYEIEYIVGRGQNV
jgi:hypothetical protein